MTEPKAAVDEPDELGALAEFWTSRRSLAAIRDLARERLVAPWAVLGGVLAFVCSRVGPHVVLPPIVGGYASLNTMWALVGSSGAGKDGAVAVARELLWLDDNIPTHEVGTGQGIDSTYTAQTGAGPMQFCDAALFTVSEIDTLAGHARMSGSTIMATLRKLYSGAALGARYADQTKRRPVREHHYRAALIAGVQPARAGVLLNDADGGTPQRWLWLPTNDPTADQATAGPVAVPESGLWQQYSYLQAVGELTDADIEDGKRLILKSRVEIKVCETARSLIVEHRRARLAGPLTGTDEGLDGHALLTRLKVAALLGLFDGGRAEVSEEDWELSDAVMAVSDATREVCVRALTETARKTNVARAHQEVERANVVAEQAEKRVAQTLLRILIRSGDWVPRAELRRRTAARDREHFEPAMSRLINAGSVEDGRAETGAGERYRAAAR